MTFEDLQRLGRGVHRVTFEEFCGVLRTSIGATEDYARGVWPTFLDHPLQYMVTRRPPAQGEGLFQLAWEKGRDTAGSGGTAGSRTTGECGCQLRTARR